MNYMFVFINCTYSGERRTPSFIRGKNLILLPIFFLICELCLNHCHGQPPCSVCFPRPGMIWIHNRRDPITGRLYYNDYIKHKVPLKLDLSVCDSVTKEKQRPAGGWSRDSLRKAAPLSWDHGSLPR